MSDIDRARDALSYIPVGGHDERMRVAASLKSAFGDEGRWLWDEWRGDRGKDDARSTWKSLKQNGERTIASLYYEAKKHGWTDSRRYNGRQKPYVPKQYVNDNEATLAEEKKQAASKARSIMARATKAEPDNPYLVLKQLQPVESLFEVKAKDVAEILGYQPRSKGELLTGRLLVVPIVQNGEISTVEFIDGQKRKASLPGHGTRSRAYWATSQLPDEDRAGCVIFIGEGMATTLTVSVSKGLPGVAALSCSNLVVVANIMREHYPSATLVILADLNKKTGKPDRHAVEAAELVKGRLAVPVFGEERDDGQTDFNDMMIKSGLDSVARVIDNLLAAPQATPDDAGCSREADWPEPMPLVARIQSSSYPIDALPDGIKDAVAEVTEYVKAPVAMVASSAIAALSVAAQALANVQRDDRLSGPVGVYIMIIAESGERKSTIDGYFTQPINDYQNAQMLAAEEPMKEYLAASVAWKCKQDGYKEEITRLTKNKSSSAEVEKSLLALEKEKPVKPKVPKLLYSDATPEALAYGLANEWPSGGILSAEAGSVFGSHAMSKEAAMRNLALQNQLWGGERVSIDRRSSESYIVQGVRLTIALQVQEAALREFFSRSGELARGIGFLARFLLVHVGCNESTQGQRFYVEPPRDWPSLRAYHQRITSILNEAIIIDEMGCIRPEVFSLTKEAKKAWVEYYNEIETELSMSGKYSQIRDFASKSADNVARLATLFHIYAGRSGDIAEDLLESAKRIAKWHLNEAKRYFEGDVLSDELRRAERFEKWLLEQCSTSTEGGRLRKNHALQYGPLRSKVDLEAAINVLADLNRLRLGQVGARTGIIEINPALMGKDANQ